MAALVRPAIALNLSNFRGEEGGGVDFYAGTDQHSVAAGQPALQT
jgi:hypothetical protein